MIKVKIKRFFPSETGGRFPKEDMHMWLTSQAMSDLGILKASEKMPQYVKIECNFPLTRFTIYGNVYCLNPRIEVEEGYLWIPAPLINEEIPIDRNTEVSIEPISLNEYKNAESVTIKLKDKEVENWSEEEVKKAISNYRLNNKILFNKQPVYIKPGTKKTTLGVVESFFPRTDNDTQLLLVGEDTKVFFEGLPKNQQKVIDFDQIGGLQNVIEKLREIIQIPITCPKYLSRFGIKPPKGMLMYGPPGNGKTMIARAVANSMGSSFISIEGPELMSKYVGVGEQRLREKFEEAETKGNCVIFIDEIDSIASERSDSSAEYQVSIVATLLNLMDGMRTNNNVFVIGATNRLNSIDPALRRPGRFDLEFEVPMPATEARLDILKKYIKLDKKDLFDVNVSSQTLSRIAELTNGYSGADISLLYRETVMIAVRRNIEIDGKTGKLQENSAIEDVKIKPQDFFEAMKHIVPTAMRSVETNINNVEWENLIGVDNAKVFLESMHQKMTVFTNTRDLLIRPSFANLVIGGPKGSGKHTLVRSFASKYGYETIDIDFMRLFTLEQTSAYSEIEKIFSKAKQVAPSIVTISNISEKSDNYLSKILHESYMVNKRSMVFLILILDEEIKKADDYIGYKKFGQAIGIDNPDPEIVKKTLSIFNVPAKDFSLFENKPIGQFIEILNEYIIDHRA